MVRIVLFIVSLILAGCTTTIIKMPENVKVSDNGSSIEEISFGWVSNQSLDKIVACLYKEIPALPTAKTAPVEVFIEQQQNQVAGFGVLYMPKSDASTDRDLRVEFKYILKHEKREEIYLLLSDIHLASVVSRSNSITYSKLTTYDQLIADSIYNNFASAVKNIQLCR